ncbi:MAG: glycoside hydrolase family 2 protein, partial [Oscillospiraceae bacterium]|nr:glycoside hydrolase family 2 protein [Oscillospiraceae bacterium]
MREIININRKWAFTKQAHTVPTEMPHNWDFVNLPHSWNNIDGQDGDNDYFRGTCYYAKQISKTDLPEKDKYFLEINGANSSADVYMNGKVLAHHDGGYSTWRVDITNHLKADNLLVIAVDNAPNNSVYPQMADFTFYGGLYRNVNIICTSESHFDLLYHGGKGIMVTPQIKDADADVQVETFVVDLKENQKLHFAIKNAENELVAEETTTDTVVNLPIKNVHLWHGKKDPYLYTAEVEILEDGKAIDNISTRFGCRTFRIDPENGFILNGEEYPLRGVSRHQDRWGLGNALLPEHHKEDMDLIREVGATTIRLAHYQHDQYFYDLCDEYGMVVWAEIPYISSHLHTGRENTISQMKELIVQNYNHPSIVVWGLSNEISMQGSDDDLIENHHILNDMVHEMDKTRLTTMAVVSMCDMDDEYVHIPDTVSYNHYFGWYGGNTDMNGPWFDKFHEKYPNTPIGCSEYGCEALNWHTSNPQQGDYTEEYQAYYHEELIKQFFSRKYLWATHVWNMFDFGADARNEGGENGQNHKGLVTFDRKYKKDAFYAYKAWLSDEPFVHICGKRYVDRVEDVTKVTVYSNLPEVEMFVNGKSIGKKSAPDHFFYFDVENVGETEIRAVAGEFSDVSHIRKVSEPNPKYRLVEKGAILNWFDITEIDGYYSINDKIEDIMKSTEGRNFFTALMSNMMKNAGGMADMVSGMGDGLMQMMGGFTVLRLTSMLGMANVSVSKEELLAINSQLNAIK